MRSTEGYQLAYRKAVSDLASRDLAEAARRSGDRLDGRRLHLAWLGNPVEVEAPREQGGEPGFLPADLTLAEKILILHYLLSTGRQPVRGFQASNWPCWRGLEGNGLSRETSWDP